MAVSTYTTDSSHALAGASEEHLTTPLLHCIFTWNRQQDMYSERVLLGRSRSAVCLIHAAIFVIQALRSH